MKKIIYKFLCLVLTLGTLIGVPLRAEAIDFRVSTRLGELLFGSEESTVILGGGVFGAKILSERVTVKSSEITKIHPGDIISEIDGKKITSAEQVWRIVSDSNGKPLEITVLRGKERLSVIVTPTLACSGYKIGLKIKDSASGIGTITFIDKATGKFGGLGHGICDSDTGELIEICGGESCGVILGGVHRGDAGKPGELSGVLTSKIIGTIEKNTECGVFGRLSGVDYSDSEEIKIGSKDKLHTGEAEILCTVKNGYPRRYKVEITEICDGSSPTKSFKIKVTDQTLISLTGGIVRGMSGSPIIQDGKLVGAVTHVLVANPTEGYGIFIENMLSAAQSEVIPKAA